MKKILITLLLLFLNTQTKAQCWKSVFTTGDSSSGIKSDGTLWTWGSSFVNGQGSNIPIQTGLDNNWQSISASNYKVFAIKIDGTLWGWGYDGNGSILPYGNNLLAQIGTASNWKSVFAGSGNVVGIKTDGTLWAWGRNDYGQLGDDTNINKSAPIQIGVSTNWKSISVGGSHIVAIKNDGTLWAWGRNDLGQLGDGTYVNKKIPIQIGNETNWQSISAGSSHTIAIKTNGTLWAWGCNDHRELGVGGIIPSFTYRNTPLQVGVANNWQYIYTGGYELTYAIKTDGTLWNWGYGIIARPGYYGSPAQVGNETNWKSISLTPEFSYSDGQPHYNVIALKTDGNITSWGNNEFGQIGDGTYVNKITPVEINCPITSLNVQQNNANNNIFIVHPNPVIETLNIENISNLNIDKIIITDISGKKVIEKTGNDKQINVQKLQKGIYIMQIFSEENSLSMKFLKQ